MGFLAGKKALIVGLATDRSIAWGISQAMHREGAELAFSYQNERIKERVVELAGELGSKLVMPMDVGVDAEIEAAFARAPRRVAVARHPRPLGRLRAARGAHRRIRRGDDARELCDRARRVELQPDGARARRAAAHGGARRLRSSRSPTSAPCARFRPTTSWGSPRRASRPTCASWRPTSARGTSA